MATTMRRIGPIGTASRVLGGLALFFLALSDGGRLSWDLRWYELRATAGTAPARRRARPEAKPSSPARREHP